LLLAQALDACIEAERRLPGSAQEVIARQPAWAHADLQRLVGLAGSLDAAATNAFMDPDFREATRARLLERIRLGHGSGERIAPNSPVALSGARLSAVPSRNGRRGARRRRARWLLRLSAGLLSAALAIAATLSVSANALPGEPLYSLKQAQEELGVRLAADDQARTLALLRRADARLDETTRLLVQGRTDEAMLTTHRYDQVVQRATTTYVVTIDDSQSDAFTAANIDTTLSQQQALLQALLQSAPELARADLREALVATERGRALVADPRPVERALGRGAGNRGVAAAGAPTVAAEEVPTSVPTLAPLVIQPIPPRQPVVADVNEEGRPALALVAQADTESHPRVTEEPAKPAQPAARPPVNTVRRTTSSPPVVNTNANGGVGHAEDQGVAPPVPAGDGHPEAVGSGTGLVIGPLQSTGVVIRPQGEDAAASEQALIRRGTPQNPADNRGGGSSASEVRGRDPETPPVVVAHPAGGATVVAENHGSEIPGRTTPTQPQASGGQEANDHPTQAQVSVGQETSDHPARESGSETRPAQGTPPSSAAKPLATPTPGPAHRSGGDGGGDKPPATAVPSHGGGDH
jgi:hypothetical protein